MAFRFSLTFPHMFPDPLPAPASAYLREEEIGDDTEHLAAEGDEERLVDEGGHAVPRPVERVRDGRTQHTVQVHHKRLVEHEKRDAGRQWRHSLIHM